MYIIFTRMCVNVHVYLRAVSNTHDEALKNWHLTKKLFTL